MGSLGMRTKRAIVLDDDSGVRGLVARVVSRAGYAVVAYSSPKETTIFSDPGSCPCAAGRPELFGESPTCAELIVTDIGMPGISGIDYIRAIREAGCGVRHVAVLSGRWDKTLDRRAEELGFRMFQKPHGLKELAAWVQSLDD